MRPFPDGDLGLSRKGYTQSQHFPMPTLRSQQAGVAFARKRQGLAHQLIHIINKLSQS
jgi:hypothetical protein